MCLILNELYHFDRRAISSKPRSSTAGFHAHSVDNTFCGMLETSQLESFLVVLNQIPPLPRESFLALLNHPNKSLTLFLKILL
jgi:hypothetical protein